jgi:hypothetical protein
MAIGDGVTRRDFVTAATGAAAATLVAGRAGAAARRRYAIVGTGVRLSCLTGSAARKSMDSGLR